MDVPTWLLSLSVASASADHLKQLVQRALVDLEKSDEPHEEVEEARRLLKSVVIPASGWRLSENFERRNPIGPTEMVLFESAGNYVFVEVHNES